MQSARIIANYSHPFSVVGAAGRLISDALHGDTCKRAFDVVVAGITLVVAAPVMAITALLIRLTDGGPAIFVQTRVGQDGHPFAFYKFRSMRPGADALKAALLAKNDHGDSITFKMKRDPRITWIGRIIRKFSIDELPQLWNVLKGDMSLVGPRPAVPAEVAQYTPYDRGRLSARPGLTCTWQVSGRADLPFDRQVELDIEYARTRNLWLDIGLLARTPAAVLSGRGAY